MSRPSITTVAPDGSDVMVVLLPKLCDIITPHPDSAVAAAQSGL
jgi:hypothetical protein